MADSRITASYTVTDMSGKKSTKSLVDLSAQATNTQINNLVVGLVGLSTSTLSTVEKVETTDITTPAAELEELGWSVYGKQDSGGGEVDKQVSLWQPTQQTSESFAFFFANKNGFGSGLTSMPAVTISGYKPKGYTFNFMQNSSMIFVTSETHSFSQSNLQLWQMKIEIAATATAKGATLYSYFRANEADVEAIS